jgi:hypothetical protein
MRSSGAVTLREIALPMLDVACSCCERRGRLSVARLIAEHGAGAKLPDLRTVLWRVIAHGSARRRSMSAAGCITRRWQPVLDLESRFRCRGCDQRGKVAVSIKWGDR